MTSPSVTDNRRNLPSWVPEAVRTYVAHTESGTSIRALAREAGCHASTVLRQVRRTEARRDDPLIDNALNRLGQVSCGATTLNERTDMTVSMTFKHAAVDDETLEREARRVLRRLNEPGACLAMADGMEKAVVARDGIDGSALKTAVVDRPVAEALALKDWIAAQNTGRIVRYRITQPGRMALKRMLAEDEARRAADPEGAGPHGDQHRDYAERTDTSAGRRRRVRYNMAESPLVVLSRRKDKDGQPFLSPALVAAGERLREDFELAQMGPRVTQNWEKFLTGGTRGEASSTIGGGSEAARTRVSAALSDLGPGLGDVVLRCCCFLEGMEAVEKLMGWSARSGKIVLRIALMRLARHYETSGGLSQMIG